LLTSLAWLASVLWLAWLCGEPGEWDPRSLLDPRDRPEQGDCGGDREDERGESGPECW